MLYQVFELSDNTRPGPPDLIQEIERVKPEIESRGGQVFGVFGGLLGLPSNNLYLVTFAESEITLNLPKQYEIVATTPLKPTIRPVEHKAASKSGVYVFRWFSVATEHVDEIVRLSGDAWPGFESSFNTEVQGLFVEEAKQPDKMLLITWYENLNVWQESRQPPTHSRENFIRRHQLTRKALPVGTYLVGTSAPGLLSQT